VFVNAEYVFLRHGVVFWLRMYSKLTFTVVVDCWRWQQLKLMLLLSSSVQSSPVQSQVFLT